MKNFEHARINCEKELASLLFENADGLQNNYGDNSKE